MYFLNCTLYYKHRHDKCFLMLPECFFLISENILFPSLCWPGVNLLCLIETIIWSLPQSVLFFHVLMHLLCFQLYVWKSVVITPLSISGSLKGIVLNLANLFMHFAIFPTKISFCSCHSASIFRHLRGFSFGGMRANSSWA